MEYAWPEQYLELITYQEKESKYISDSTELMDLFSKLNKKDLSFFTVILEMESINRSSFEGTKFVNVEYETGSPTIRDVAYRLMQEKYGYGAKWAEEIINKYYPKESTPHDIWLEEVDGYVESTLQSFYPEALEELLEELVFDKLDGDPEDFSHEEYLRLAEQYQEELQQYKTDVFLPSYEKSYSINYDVILPNLLSDIVHGCRIKQYYFIKQGQKLLYQIGCSCGSQTRFLHGLFGHCFALLQSNGHVIPTFVTAVNNKCEFSIKKITDSLELAIRHDLTGNFEIDSEQSEKILQGVELV